MAILLNQMSAQRCAQNRARRALPRATADHDDYDEVILHLHHQCWPVRAIARHIDQRDTYISDRLTVLAGSIDTAVISANKNEIIRLYSDGLSAEDVADIRKIKLFIVRKILRDAGVTRPCGRFKKN